MLPYTDYYAYQTHRQRLQEAETHHAHPRPLPTRSAFPAQLAHGVQTLRRLRQVRVRITLELSETPPVRPEGC